MFSKEEISASFQSQSRLLLHIGTRITPEEVQ